ncbi:MAG: hypothetical protein NT062_24915 [Proteobacteria bacterium]|nr:hypothetical protein [Pseudomonadota bacterium]
MVEPEPVLDGAVQHRLSHRLAVEPGGGVDATWRSTLATHGVAATDEDTRSVAQRELGMLRGALPIEVEACVVAIATTVAPELVHGARATWIAFAPLYLERARHRHTSMFAHALASAKAKRNAHWFRPPGGYVMRCDTCGGPRLSAESLACQFCETGKLTNP